MMGFTQIDNSILRDASLSLAEFRIYLVLESHAWNCDWPSISQIVAETGCSNRTVVKTLRALEKRGLIIREGGPGRRNKYTLVAKTNSAHLPISNRAKVNLSNSAHLPISPQKNPAPEAAKSSAEYSLIQEKDKKPPVVPLEKGDATRKPRKSKKQPMTFEQVQQSINTLDTDKFAKAYPGVDVLGEFEKFRDHYLGGNDLRTGKPLWQKWTDWGRAFHTWCRNAKKWAQERASPEKDAPRLPVLKGVDEEGNLIYE